MTAKRKTQVALPLVAKTPYERAKSDALDLPTSPAVVLLAILVILALLCAAYLAAEVVLPIVLALVLKLLFQPAMRFLDRLRVPRGLAALALILLVFGAIVGIGAGVSGPAAEWATKLPNGIARLQERLKFLSEPIDTLRTFLNEVGGSMPGAGRPSTNGGGSASAIAASLFSSTTYFARSFFETILILFFLLVSGNTSLKKLVEIMPNFRTNGRLSNSLWKSRKIFPSISSP